MIEMKVALKSIFFLFFPPLFLATTWIFFSSSVDSNLFFSLFKSHQIMALSSVFTVFGGGLLFASSRLFSIGLMRKTKEKEAELESRIKEHESTYNQLLTEAKESVDAAKLTFSIAKKKALEEAETELEKTRDKYFYEAREEKREALQMAEKLAKQNDESQLFISKQRETHKRLYKSLKVEKAKQKEALEILSLMSAKLKEDNGIQMDMKAVRGSISEAAKYAAEIVESA